MYPPLRGWCWKSPPESSSLSVGARDELGALDVPFQTMFAVGLQMVPLAVGFDGSKLRDRPFMCTRIYPENMYIIYSARLQRPSVGSRVHRARSVCPLSLATGLIIIPGASRSCGYHTAAQEGGSYARLCPRLGTWLMMLSNVSRKLAKLDLERLLLFTIYALTFLPNIKYKH